MEQQTVSSVINTVSLTEDQKSILIHATGNGRGYRMHYCPGESDVPVLDALTELGLTEKRGMTYLVTKTGLRVARALYLVKQFIAGNRPWLVTVRDEDDVQEPSTSVVWAKSRASARAKMIIEMRSVYSIPWTEAAKLVGVKSCADGLWIDCGGAV